jgi:hypothetical protein
VTGVWSALDRLHFVCFSMSNLCLLYCAHSWTFCKLACPGREFSCLRCGAHVQSIGVRHQNITSLILGSSYFWPFICNLSDHFMNLMVAHSILSFGCGGGDHTATLPTHHTTIHQLPITKVITITQTHHKLTARYFQHIKLFVSP